MCQGRATNKQTDPGQLTRLTVAALSLQVADMATQTLPLPQLQLPPAGQLQRPSSGPDGRDANTMLYGVNAAMASGRAANGAALCKLQASMCLLKSRCLQPIIRAEPPC